MLSNFYKKILTINDWQDRQFIRNVISLLEKEWNDKNVFVIEAPTGYGKSAISQVVSLYSVANELKSIVVFPLKTLLEDQYDKFRRIVNANEMLGKRYMHNFDSRYLTKPMTLTTIDTLALTLFGIPPEDLDKVVRKWSGTGSGSLGHYLFSQSSILFSNIILDEVHLLSDSVKSLTFLALLIKFAVDNGQKLILMSATIPSTLEETLFDCVNAETMEIVRFDSKNRDFYDKQFVDERKKKNYKIFLHKVKGYEKYDRILLWIKNESFKKRIIVFNTVEDSVNLFTSIKDDKTIENKILLHSRFNEIDRERKVKKLKGFKNVDEYLIISTQTIEAGVDISSNLFITEIAPANSLIQRLGRFLRYEGENEGEVHIWYETDENGILKKDQGNRYKVYDWELTNRTIESLKRLGSFTEHDEIWESTSEKMNFHIPEGYKDLLNSVYIKDDFQIDQKNVEDFFRIFLNMEQLSKKSLEKFIELEGSFIRDEMLIPIMTRDAIIKLISYKEKIELDAKQINYVTNQIIPVSMSQVSKFNPKEYLVIRRDEEQEKEMLEKKSIPSYVMKSAEKLFIFMLKCSPVALIVDRMYDEELGLLTEGIKDE